VVRESYKARAGARLKEFARVVSGVVECKSDDYHVRAFNHKTGRKRKTPVQNRTGVVKRNNCGCSVKSQSFSHVCPTASEQAARTP
jgi:transposase